MLLGIKARRTQEPFFCHSACSPPCHCLDCGQSRPQRYSPATCPSFFTEQLPHRWATNHRDLGIQRVSHIQGIHICSSDPKSWRHSQHWVEQSQHQAVGTFSAFSAFPQLLLLSWVCEWNAILTKRCPRHSPVWWKCGKRMRKRAAHFGI